MIVGLGIDLVEISRVAASWQRFGQRFARRILHPAEFASMPAEPISFLAARFAAKEAAVKALGTGFVAGIWFQDLCVENLPGGQPRMHFLNGAAQRLGELGATSGHLSMTHSRETAAAVVVLSKD